MAVPDLDVYGFQYGDSGVELNADAPTPPFVDIIKVGGLDSAPFRTTEHDHEGTDGGFVDSLFEKTRVVEIECNVYMVQGAEQTYLDLLKGNFAPQADPVPLYFKSTDGTTRLVYGKSQGIRYDWAQPLRQRTIMGAQIIILCEDPSIYDSNATIVGPKELSGDAGFGRGYDRSYNLSYGGGGSTNALQVTNYGNRPADGTFVITGPVINPGITSDTEGKTLAFNLTLVEGESLTINLRNRTVLLNGTANRRSSMLAGSQWFMIQPGTNTIRFLGTQSPLTPKATIFLTTRSAWR